MTVFMRYRTWRETETGSAQVLKGLGMPECQLGQQGVSGFLLTQAYAWTGNVVNLQWLLLLGQTSSLLCPYL